MTSGTAFRLQLLVWRCLCQTPVFDTWRDGNC